MSASGRGLLTPSEAEILRAAEILRRGGLVAFPTETVYGLGANALDEAAVRRIFAVKGRPANNPLIVHVAEIADVQRVAAAWPDAAERLAQRFWPGPLSMVLPKRPELPDVITAGGPTVAIRIPAHPVARRLLELAAVPVAAPSANRSGEISPTTAEHVRRSLGYRVDLILDGGPTTVGLESTVLSLAESPPRLLRPGHITPEQIEEVVGPIARGARVSSEAALPSPGLLPRHYAPRTPTEVIEGSSADRVHQLVAVGQRVGWVAFPDFLSGGRKPPEESSWGLRPPLSDSNTEVMRWMPANPAEYAGQLYAVLHELDQLELDHIVVDLPPATEEWLAVRDRLGRAAHD